MNDRNIKEYDLRDISKRFSILPQKVKLFPLTLRDNIAFGAGGYDGQQEEESILQAAQRAGAADFIAKHPKHLDATLAPDAIRYGRRGPKTGDGTLKLFKPSDNVHIEKSTIVETPTGAKVLADEDAVKQMTDFASHLYGEGVVPSGGQVCRPFPAHMDS